MSRSYPRISVLLLISIPVAAVASLAVLGALAGGSCGGTLQTGRAVNARSDSIYPAAHCTADTATIKTWSKTVVARPTAVEVDGAKVATIDEAARMIDVAIKDGAVTLTADGKPVALKSR